MNLKDNNELLDKLVNALPDERMLKRARAFTVVSDNGTEIELKNIDRNPYVVTEGELSYFTLMDLKERVLRNEVPEILYLDTEISYSEIDKYVSELENKAVKVSSKVFRDRGVKNILKEI